MIEYKLFLDICVLYDIMILEEVIPFSLYHGSVILTEDLDLKNKPLVEVIFELHWELYETTETKNKIDPHYSLLIGTIYSEAKSDYKYHERLPSSEIPDRLAPYVIQHRFRKADGQWPLIQMGPGIITLNETTGYAWRDFSRRVSDLIDMLFRVYPEPEKLDFSKIMLRYIDAISFDYNDDILEFLSGKMKTEVRFQQDLFKNTGVKSTPFDLDLRFAFHTINPKGAMDIRIRRGKGINGEDALIWNTIIHSMGDDIPKTKEDIATWVDQAHTVTHDWFFKMIEGELLEEFR